MILLKKWYSCGKKLYSLARGLLVCQRLRHTVKFLSEILAGSASSTQMETTRTNVRRWIRWVFQTAGCRDRCSASWCWNRQGWRTAPFHRRCWTTLCCPVARADSSIPQPAINLLTVTKLWLHFCILTDLEFSRLESWSRDVSKPVFTSLGLGLGLEPRSLVLVLVSCKSWVSVLVLDVKVLVLVLVLKLLSLGLGLG